MISAIASILSFISGQGLVPSLPREERKAYELTRTGAALAAAVTLIPLGLSLASGAAIDEDRRFTLIPNGSAALIYLLCWILLRYRFIRAGKLILLTTALTHMTALVAAFGIEYGVHYFYIAAFIAPLVVLGKSDRVLRLLFVLAPALLFVAANYYFAVLEKPGLVAAPQTFAYKALFLMANSSLALVFIGGFFYHFYHAGAVAEERLDRERGRSESLLLNILPGPIAERLKNGERLIADRHDQVTVLFADIVGFTELSARLAPGDLIGILNETFVEFDRLADRFGVEKIKTIGDAYMAVAGVPAATEDHAIRITKLALAMQESLEEMKHGAQLRLRIGIHSGPIVAGVIGERKFSYDLWGDTVNTAARMESHGEAGRIQISGAAHTHLAGAFRFDEPREIDVKGKGRMQTYFIARA